MVKRYRVRRDGGPGGSNATGALYRALIHAGWCCGMSEEVARVSGACPPPLTDGAAAGTWRGETDASGLHGVDVAVGLARMLLPGVPMGRTDTTGWRGPLVKARLWEVKGLDLVINRSRVSRDGGPGGSNATGATYRALIHTRWCCGMSEEAARVSGAWPLSRTAPPAAPRGGKLPLRFYTEWM